MQELLPRLGDTIDDDRERRLSPLNGREASERDRLDAGSKLIDDHEVRSQRRDVLNGLYARVDQIRGRDDGGRCGNFLQTLGALLRGYDNLADLPARGALGGLG